MLRDILSNPALPRALVLGAFGAVGLVLTSLYSRRGPMIYLPYAALEAALAFVLARYPGVGYVSRFSAAFAGFLMATVPLYISVGTLAQARRQYAHRGARFPSAQRSKGLSLWGHTWRMAFVLSVGGVVSAGVAYIAA